MNLSMAVAAVLAMIADAAFAEKLKNFEFDPLFPRHAGGKILGGISNGSTHK